MDCSEVCRMNVVRLISEFTSVSTYSTNTTFYKKKYIKDNNTKEIYKEKRDSFCFEYSFYLKFSPVYFGFQGSTDGRYYIGLKALF